MRRQARVAELVDAMVSKAIAPRGVRVRVPPRAFIEWQDRLHAQDPPHPPANAPSMLGIVLSAVPIGIAIGLLAFGTYGGRQPVVNRPRVAAAAAATVALGPGALALLGLLDWIMLLAVLILLLTVYVAGRQDLAHAWRLVRR